VIGCPFGACENPFAAKAASRSHAFAVFSPLAQRGLTGSGPDSALGTEPATILRLFPVVGAGGEWAEQLVVDLPPDHARPGSATPQAAPGEAAVRASAGGGRGLVVHQDEPQRGNSAGVVTRAF
jgi:hypothetical protein